MGTSGRRWPRGLGLPAPEGRPWVTLSAPSVLYLVALHAETSQAGTAPYHHASPDIGDVAPSRDLEHGTRTRTVGAAGGGDSVLELGDEGLPLFG